MLSRDIRSVTQRIKVPQRAQQGGPAALHSSGGAGGGGGGVPQQQQQQQQQQQAGERQEGYWKVVLDGVEISYDVEDGSRDVVVRSARPVPTD